MSEPISKRDIADVPPDQAEYEAWERKANEQKHTSLPWSVDVEGSDTYIMGDGLVTTVAEVGGRLKKEAEANARFIVTACNSHTALVAACEEARPSLEAVLNGAGSLSINKRKILVSLLGDIEEALKLAKEGLLASARDKIDAEELKSPTPTSTER